MTTTWTTLLADVPAFSAKIEDFLTELGIFEIASSLEADHLGLRMANPKDIEALKAELSAVGECFSTAVVNGREILLYQLTEPLAVGPWKVSGIELPYPKPGHSHEDGWEHMELVIPSNAATLDEMRSVLLEHFPTLNIDILRKNGRYSEALPSSEEDQLPNPSLAIKSGSGVTVKFHPRSIQEVVGLTLQHPNQTH